jgi:hypothetical protein
MANEKNEPLKQIKEGFSKKGGINPAPSTPRPNVKPQGQQPQNTKNKK